MLTRLVGPVSRVARAGTRRYHADDKPFKLASMDEAVQPEGCWQEYYNKRQKTYNLQLIGGALFLAATIAYGNYSGCFYMNMSPPKPKPKTSDA